MLCLFGGVFENKASNMLVFEVSFVQFLNLISFDTNICTNLTKNKLTKLNERLFWECHNCDTITENGF